MKLSELFTRKNKGTLKIEVYISTADSGKPIHLRLNLNVPEGSTLNDPLRLLDRKKVVGKNFFKKLIKSGKFFTLLVGGERINIPDGLKRQVCESDKIAIITPMAGG